MAEHSGTREFGNSAAAAHYVATLTTELAMVARLHGLETLAYLLDMARLEAEHLGRGSEGRTRAP